MTEDIVLIAYAALAALGIFAAVLALLRLRRENQELRDRLRVFEMRRDRAETVASGPRQADDNDNQMPRHASSDGDAGEP